MFHSSIYSTVLSRHTFLLRWRRKKHAIGELTFIAGRDRIMMFYRNTNSGDHLLARHLAIIYK